MAKDGKFGTFGGVFTPSILTILGVIMYLRLPLVVGEGGLQTALAIILTAHVISVCTGLSISSIATDKAVGAGGPYYIISRSLGLPLGGTIGIALFFGLSFSISLYIIGFSESLLSALEIPANAYTIRVAGTITLVALTVLTFISTALAIKTQYVILALIALSLLSIFLGQPDAPAQVHWRAPEGAESPAVLFGIFFPAVTGFTAGVNMSGDLRDARRSIPVGSMAAIAGGFVVYLALAAFLAFRVDPQLLRDDPNLLVSIALVPTLVVAGIWGATLSSALGSILGAPRILQALGADRITPAWFARGTGKTNEPRNALLLAFLIGEAGILIAELDAIAEIVSMVFLALYGFLNLIAAIEMWSSPDFRPTFKIHWIFPVLGAAASFVVMVQLNLVAMMASGAILLGLYLLLQRRQLRLEAGDTWEGVWATVVRSGLYRLSQSAPQARNWRPNILAFSRMGRMTGTRPYLLRFGRAMVRGRGLFTDVVLQPPRLREQTERIAPVADDEELPVGMFHDVVKSPDDVATIRQMCRYHGVIGLRPNAVLLDWTDVCSLSPEVSRADPSVEDGDFEAMFADIASLDLSLMLFRYHAQRGFGDRRRVDVWWRRDGGNLPFALALLRFITTSSDWSNVVIRVLIFSEDVADNEHLTVRARRLLQEVRMDASVRALNVTPEEETYSELVVAQSRDADLVLMGSPLGVTGSMQIDEQCLAGLGTALLYRAATSIEPALRLRRDGGTTAVVEAVEDAPSTEFAIDVDKNPDVYPPARTFGRRLAELTSDFDRRAMQAIYDEETRLIEEISTVVTRHFNLLEKGVTGSHARRLRRATNRVNSSLLKASRTMLTEYRDQGVARQEGILELRLREALDVELLVQAGIPLTVHRPLEEFAPAASDDGWVRRFKRRRRLGAAIKRREPSYVVDLPRLQAFYRARFINEVLARALQTMRADGHAMVGELGQLIQGAQTAMSLTREAGDAASVEDYVQRKKEAAVTELQDLLERHRERAVRTRGILWTGAQELAQSFADDLSRLDVNRRLRRELRLREASERIGQEHLESLGVWVDHRGRLVDQVEIGLSIAHVQHRVAEMVHRIRDAHHLELRNGILAELQSLQQGLNTFEEELGGSEIPQLKGRFDFRGKERGPRRESVESLQRELPSLLEDLPETVKVLDAESYGRLLEGNEDKITSIDLPLRRLVSYLIENELMASLQSLLGGAMYAEEERARSVGLDVVRLVRAQRKEADAAGEEEEDGGDFEVNMAALLERSRARVAEEIKSVEAFAGRLVKDVQKHLSESRSHTQLQELVRQGGRLLQDRRRLQGRQAYSGVRRQLDGWLEQTSERAITAVYGGQSILSFLRQMGGPSQRAPLSREEVLTRIQAMQPRADVLKALPYYYRQLFVGQSSTDEAFWAPRKELQSQARRGLANHRRGIPGIMLVTGNRGAGKSAFVQWMTSGPLSKNKVYRVLPRRSGSSDPTILDRVFESETGIVGSLEEQLRALPPRSVMVLRDFELWWTRAEGDDEAVKRLLDMFDAHAGRVIFIVEVGRSALELFDRLYGLRARALAVMECENLGMREISDIILARHLSAGLSLTVDGTPLEALSALQKARMFALFQERAGGNVGQALRAWIAALDAVDGQTLEMTVPVRTEHELLDHLTEQEEAMLVAFEVHRALTKARVARLLDVGLREVEEVIGGLVRAGLLEESSADVFEISKYAYMAIWRHLHRRGLVC